MVTRTSTPLLNLTLTVIVDSAAEARAKDGEEGARDKKENKSKAIEELVQLVRRIDKNGDGMISIGEVMDAYENVPAFRNDGDGSNCT